MSQPSHSMSSRLAGLAALFGLLAASACGGGGSDAPATPAASPAPAVDSGPATPDTNEPGGGNTTPPTTNEETKPTVTPAPADPSADDSVPFDQLYSSTSCPDGNGSNNKESYRCLAPLVVNGKAKFTNNVCTFEVKNTGEIHYADGVIDKTLKVSEASGYYSSSYAFVKRSNQYLSADQTSDNVTVDLTLYNVQDKTYAIEIKLVANMTKKVKTLSATFHDLSAGRQEYTCDGLAKEGESGEGLPQ